MPTNHFLESVLCTFPRTGQERGGGEGGSAPDADPMAENDPDAVVVVAPVICRLRGGRGRVIVPDGCTALAKPRPDAVLMRALRKGHKVAAAMGWRAADGSVDLAATAPADCYERRLVLLAFLAPDIQQAVLEGRQPPSLTLERLVKKPIPTAWNEQRRELGF